MTKKNRNSKTDDDRDGKPLELPSVIKKIIRVIKIMVTIVSIVLTIKTNFDYAALIAFLSAVIALLSDFAFPPKISPKLFVIGIAFLIASIVILSYSIIDLRIIFKITYPASNQQVSRTIQSVKGDYRNIAENQLIWVVVQGKEKGIFYLSDAVLATKDGDVKKGTWEAINVPVGSFLDSGKIFYIWAILIEENSPSDKEFRDWKKKCDSQGFQSLPTHKRNTTISVKRQ